MGKLPKEDSVDADVDRLIAALDFVDESVSTAAVEQPSLYLKASRIRIKAMRKVSRASAALEVLKAERSLAIRQKALSSGARLTEGLIGDKLSTDPDIQAAQLMLDRAKEAEEFSKLLLDAFRMRRDSIKVVADLIGVEVSVQKHVAGPSELKSLKSRLSQKYRKE